jgi:hypothetical protein
MVSKIKSHILLIVTLVVAFSLRFPNLNFSNYQGDEIKALYLPGTGGFFDFIMDQRKGPLQFIITFLIKFLTPDYSNYVLTRLPFAIAGFLAVFVFYKLVALHFGKRTAFFASLFFATNGFLVAFSRIVQYQSFVILFMLLALYLFALAVSDEKLKIKGIYFGLICWAISILAHYDGAFIAPMLLYYFIMWVRKYGLTKRNVAHLLGAAAIAGALLLSFYIPFVLTLSAGTRSYWANRIVNSNGKSSSSVYLFNVYQPLGALEIYKVCAICFVAFMAYLAITLVKRYKKSLSITQMLAPVSYGGDFSLLTGLLAWFAVPFLFMEVYVYTPGTHIYTYLIPAFMLFGVGINFVYVWLGQLLKTQVVGYAVFGLVTTAFLFLGYQSFSIFVTRVGNYPWDNAKFLIWHITMPSDEGYNLSMFGFPYNGYWDQVAAYIKSSADTDITAYSTNEKSTLSNFYIPLKRNEIAAGYYIKIAHPQSFSATESDDNNELTSKPRYWMKTHAPVMTYERDGAVVASIYKMPTGSLSQLKAREAQ